MAKLVIESFLILFLQNAALLTTTNGETALSTTHNAAGVSLKCNYCRGAFSLKPETLEWQVRSFYPDV